METLKKVVRQLYKHVWVFPLVVGAGFLTLDCWVGILPRGKVIFENGMDEDGFLIPKRRETVFMKDGVLWTKVEEIGEEMTLKRVDPSLRWVPGKGWVVAEK